MPGAGGRGAVLAGYIRPLAGGGGRERASVGGKGRGERGAAGIPGRECAAAARGRARRSRVSERRRLRARATQGAGPDPARRRRAPPLFPAGRASAAASAQRPSFSAKLGHSARPPRAFRGSADTRDGAKVGPASPRRSPLRPDRPLHRVSLGHLLQEEWAVLARAVAALHLRAPLRCHPDRRLDG